MYSMMTTEFMKCMYNQNSTNMMEYCKKTTTTATARATTCTYNGHDTCKFQYYHFLTLLPFFEHIHTYLNKWKVTRIVTGRIMPRNNLPGINSRWVKGCHDIPIICWGAVVTIEDNYVFCKMKLLWITCSTESSFAWDVFCLIRKLHSCITDFKQKIHIHAMNKSIEFTGTNYACLACYIVHVF